MPFQVDFRAWIPFDTVFGNGFFFILDEYTWIFAFSTATILLAIVLSESTRIAYHLTGRIWVSIFIIAAIGQLVVLSNSILAIILIWTVVDIVEFGVMLGTIKNQQQVYETTIAFTVRIIGTVLLISAGLLSNNLTGSFAFGSLSFEVGMLTLVAIGLRLGVLPFNLPYSREIPLRRGLGNMIRMVSVASSLVVVNRFSIIVNEGQGSIIITILHLAVLSASILWLISKNELDGRPYWLIALSGFVIISILNSEAQAAVSWSLVLMLIGSLLFLYSDRNRWLNGLPLMGFVILLGLPFTPNALGWSGIVGNNLFFSILNVVSILLILIGYV